MIPHSDHVPHPAWADFRDLIPYPADVLAVLTLVEATLRKASDRFVLNIEVRLPLQDSVFIDWGMLNAWLNKALNPNTRKAEFEICGVTLRITR